MPLYTVLALYVVVELGLLVWIMRAPHRAIWVLLTLLPLHLLVMTLVFHFLHPSRVVLSLFQVWKDVIIAVTLVRQVADRRAWRGQRLHPVDAAIAVVAILAVGSIALHPLSRLASEILALRDDFILVPLYLMGRLSWVPRDFPGRMLRVVAGVCIVLGLAAVAEVFFSPVRALVAIDLPGYYRFNFHLVFLHNPALPYAFYTSDNMRRVGSLFIDPVDLAESALVAIGVGVGLLRAGGRAVIVGALTTALGVLTTAVSRGRTEFIAGPVLVLGGLASAGFGRTGIRRGPPVVFALLATLILLGAAAILFLAAPDSVPGLVDRLHLQDPSSRSHFGSLQESARLLLRNPFMGSGLGHSGLVGARFGRSLGEGQLYNLLSDLGDLAVLAVIVMLILALVTAFRAASDPSRGGLGTMVFVCLLGILINFPIAEIFSNLFVMAATFWTLGHLLRTETA